MTMLLDTNWARAPRVLSISYDEALLVTRQKLLERRGVIVVSALGFVQSIRACQEEDFDLIVIGHSIPMNDKRELYSVAKEHNPQAPVLILSRQNPPCIDWVEITIGATYGPEGFLSAVNVALGNHDA